APTGGDRNRSGSKSGSLLQQEVSLFRFGALRHKVLTWLHFALQADGISCERSVLDHDDGVGARRERSPGHDGGTLAFLNLRKLAGDAGADLGDDLQRTAISRADGVPVARGAREGREVTVSGDRFREDAVE